MATAASKWQAQLTNGSIMTGGQGLTTDVNISAVPMDQVKIFTVAHNTYSHTYYAPTKVWYKDGKPWPAPGYQYPTQYTLPDNTTLTVDSANGQLKLTQV